MSKQEIIAAIQECARKLGRAPSCTELNRMMRITRAHYREHFANYTEADSRIRMRGARRGAQDRVGAAVDGLGGSDAQAGQAAHAG